MVFWFFKNSLPATQTQKGPAELFKLKLTLQGPSLKALLKSFKRIIDCNEKFQTDQYKDWNARTNKKKEAIFNSYTDEQLTIRLAEANRVQADELLKMQRKIIMHCKRFL